MRRLTSIITKRIVLGICQGRFVVARKATAADTMRGAHLFRGHGNSPSYATRPRPGINAAVVMVEQVVDLAVSACQAAADSTGWLRTSRLAVAHARKTAGTV